MVLAILKTTRLAQLKSSLQDDVAGPRLVADGSAFAVGGPEWRLADGEGAEERPQAAGR